MTEDPSGFSSDELVKFLQQEPPRFVPETLLVMKEGETKPTPMSIYDVERLFGFTYRPFLTLPNRDAFQWIVGQCPFLLRFASLAKENHELFAVHRNKLDEAIIPAVSIRWVNPAKEYGLFTEEKIAAGAFFAEYTGIVRRLWRLNQDTNVYCLYYPTNFWSFNYCTIDGKKCGNITRFINHSDDPNLEIKCLIDRGLVHVALIAKRDIAVGEELSFDYGPDFWRDRQKSGQEGHL